MFEIGAGLVKSPFSVKSGKIPSANHPLPPSGTSARKAYEKTSLQGTRFPNTTLERLTGTYNYPAKSFVSSLSDSSSGSFNGRSKPSAMRKRSSGGSSVGSSGGYSGGYSGSFVPDSAASTFDYYEAPIAQKYGFSKTTAYQEALANTAYRREMADMRKAGLNPSVIYGSHSTSGADSNIIPRDDFGQYSFGGSSGGSSGYGRRSRRGNSGKYAFSGGSYYGIMAGVGAITAMATGNVGAGMAAAGLAGTAMKALNGFLKK